MDDTREWHQRMSSGLQMNLHMFMHTYALDAHVHAHMLKKNVKFNLFEELVSYTLIKCTWHNNVHSSKEGDKCPTPPEYAVYKNLPSSVWSQRFPLTNCGISLNNIQHIFILIALKVSIAFCIVSPLAVRYLCFFDDIW